MKQYLMIAMCCMWLAMGAAAQPTPVATAARKQLLIGEPVQVTLELRAVPRTTPVQWNLPDSLEHFVYLGVDTTDLLKRIITITSWDSGLWKLQGITATIPSTSTGKPLPIAFPAVELEVQYDTTGNRLLNDIKPIMEVDDAGDWWIGAAIAGATLLSWAALWYVFSRWRRRSDAPAFFTADDTAEDWMTVLLKLKTASWSEAEQKSQMTTLSLALRRVLQSQLGISLTSLSTPELELAVQPNLKRNQLQQLVQILRLTDAVKFARFRAPEAECRTAVEQALQLVQDMDNQHT